MTDLTDAIDRLAGALPANPEHDAGSVAVRTDDIRTITHHIRAGLEHTRLQALDRAITAADIGSDPDTIVSAARAFERYLTGSITSHPTAAQAG